MTPEKEEQILALKARGQSLRGIARLASASKGSVERVLRQQRLKNLSEN